MPAQIVLVVAGLWLEFAPWLLGHEGAAAISDHIAGPVMAATAFLSIFAITRGLRWINLVTGVWLVVAPWVLGFPLEATISSLICGVLALVLAPIGSIDQTQYGGGWIVLFRTKKLVWPGTAPSGAGDQNHRL